MYDLPSEDPEEPGLPDEFHYYQPQLLRETFCPPIYPAEQICVATDLNLYYDPQHPTWYKRPDWFAILGIPRFYEGHELRYSYVIWQERVIPFLVVELLSEGTEAEDLGQTVRDIKQPPTKWQVYEQLLQIPYYLVFSRHSEELRVFQWQGGRYQRLTLSEGKVWLPEIQLGIGLWYGDYQGLKRLWLRWYDAQHHWIPTPLEQLEQERQQAEQERQRAEQEHQRAERLAAQLKALGIEPQ
ncbi:MAG: Uma2 family endonuclease [Thioploca sp.]|nr:Uma2 family endonuclease [Thioploca sp.]